jgi:hypothetical protein
MDWKAKWGIAAVCASILAGVIVLPAAAPENRDGLCPVWAQDVKKVGYIDKTGREVVPPQFDRTRRFFEGLAWVTRNGKEGYIDKTGREVLPIRYESASHCANGLYVVSDAKKDAFYLLDANGKRIAEFDRQEEVRTRTITSPSGH